MQNQTRTASQTLKKFNTKMKASSFKHEIQQDRNSKLLGEPKEEAIQSEPTARLMTEL
jgi:hypothetical protein